MNFEYAEDINETSASSLGRKSPVKEVAEKVDELLQFTKKAHAEDKSEKAKEPKVTEPPKLEDKPPKPREEFERRPSTQLERDELAKKVAGGTEAAVEKTGSYLGNKVYTDFNQQFKSLTGVTVGELAGKATGGLFGGKKKKLDEKSKEEMIEKKATKQMHKNIEVMTKDIHKLEKHAEWQKTGSFMNMIMSAMSGMMPFILGGALIGAVGTGVILALKKAFPWLFKGNKEEQQAERDATIAKQKAELDAGKIRYKKLESSRMPEEVRSKSGTKPFTKEEIFPGITEQTESSNISEKSYGKAPEKFFPINPKKLESHSDLISKYAKKYGVSEDLIKSIMWQESRGKSTATSEAGAKGLMQLKPDTAAAMAKEMGLKDYNINDPEFNVEAGVRFIAKQMKYKLAKGNLERALAMYNWGYGHVRDIGMENLPSETSEYIYSIKKNMELLKESKGISPEITKLLNTQIDESKASEALKNTLGLQSSVSRKSEPVVMAKGGDTINHNYINYNNVIFNEEIPIFG